MQASMNPEATFVLISIALRSGYAIGLHRWLDGFGLSKSELEQRQLVFWVAYTLEKSMCFRIGRPSAINDEDIGVPIPSESLLEGRSMGISVPSNPDRKFYTFRATCFIALIESRVCSELYSARSWMRSPNERLQRISRLDQELQEWKDSIPIELRPEETVQCARDQRFAALMLQFSYYNCMTAIHRASIHHGSWTSTENVPTQGNTPRSRSNPENSPNLRLLCAMYFSSALHGPPVNPIPLSRHRSPQFAHLAGHLLPGHCVPNAFHTRVAVPSRSTHRKRRGAHGTNTEVPGSISRCWNGNGRQYCL